MKRVFLSILLAVTTLMADYAPAPYRTTLPPVTGDSVTIDDPGIAVGTSGIVIHAFDTKHSTIIATAVVTERKAGKITVRFQKFRRLRQRALPEYRIAPAAGDSLILNYLYNRVLPVVPDEAHYRSFQQETRLDLLHPDLLAAQLYFDHNPRPDRGDFQKICRDYDFNLLYFAIGNEGHYVDCTSFEVVHSEPLAQPVEAQQAKQPFYSRLPKIKNRLGGIMGGESIGDYNRYYRKLLKLEK